MKRDLFVFSGQSNMMGASVLPPKRDITYENSFEYKHKPRRLGAPVGAFTPKAYPVGEFSYADMEKAYTDGTVNEKGESTLTDYAANSYFCPAMSNLRSEAEKSVYKFVEFSEAYAPTGVSLAPFLVEEWEKMGNKCAYAHIAKGAVSITHYFTDEMAEEYSRRIDGYNRENGTSYSTVVERKPKMKGSAEYFMKKSLDFFEDAEKAFFEDDMPNKCFFWLQGESDTGKAPIEIEIKMDILWEWLKKNGFTHFFCIRVDYFGSSGISNVMKAQESFCRKHRDAYMLTRAASYITYPDQDEGEWFVTPPAEEYRYCRDSFFGYGNQHINEKGFTVIARHAARNLQRVLNENKEPKLEPENIKPLAE